MEQLKQMLQWKRPGRDIATEVFANTYLLPVFGEPDVFGNYILTINNKDGSHPNLCFTAHYDTVHAAGGFQELKIEGDTIKAVDSDCLGADCTTGIWLCLEMIKACIPAVYVIHAEEESGCVGSTALVASEPVWISCVDAVISFDRFGTTSVITHQCGQRTASNAFAKSFADALDMPQLIADDGGIYTDSNEYAGVVSECTNISVGYYHQHTSKEYQDLPFLESLRDSLIKADWSKLVFKRDPKVVELEDYSYFGSNDKSYGSSYSMWEYEDLLDLVMSAPEELAQYLNKQGITAAELAEEAGIDSSSYLSRYLEREVL